MTVTTRYDIDSFLVFHKDFSVVKSGIRFDVYPWPYNNLTSSVHLWWKGRGLHEISHVQLARFNVGDAEHASIYLFLPNVRKKNKKKVGQDDMINAIPDDILKEFMNLWFPGVRSLKDAGSDTRWPRN